MDVLRIAILERSAQLHRGDGHAGSGWPGIGKQGKIVSLPLQSPPYVGNGALALARPLEAATDQHHQIG